MNKLMKQMTVLLIALSVVACGKKEVKDKKGEITYKSVKSMEANLRELNNIAVSSGSLDSINEMEEITTTGGDVVKINFKNGDRVEKGETILILDNKEIESAYLDSKAKVISTKADYDTTKVTFDKYKILYEEKLISEEEFLDIKNKLATSEGSYRSAKATLIKNQKNYNDLTLKAKIDGKVANLDFKLYQKIEEDVPLFKIVDNDELRILGGVSSKDIIGLKTGATANIYVEGSKEAVVGTLYEINPISNPSTRKFEVKIKLDNEEGRFRQGMFAKVELYTGQKEGIAVPKKAIIIEELNSYIYISREENVDVEIDGEIQNKEMLVARKIRVDLGVSDGDYQEVISSDLESENQVIVMGQYSLNDGDFLKEEK